MGANASKARCAICKGSKHLCGRPVCPILERARIKSNVMPKLSQEIFGSSPSALFVGTWNYPKVYLGPLVPPEIGDTSVMDAPERWYGKSLEDIIGFRSSLVRSKELVPVESARDPNRSLQLMQEIVMSDAPVDTEMRLEKKPSFSLKFSEFSPPHGPSEMLEKLDIASSPSIPRPVDKVHGDDLRATAGIELLHNKGIEVSHIAKLLSAGILGEQNARKFVPTRWSITATDDILSKSLMKDIRTYPSINEYQVFFSEDVGNRLAALLIPGIWSYEFIECWLPGALFSGEAQTPSIISDWEYFYDRKKYADVVAGAYYAGRLPLSEYLHEKRRQATGIVIMEVLPSYHTPVGVWRIRTILEHAFSLQPKKFETLEEAVAEIDRRMDVAADTYLERSQLLHFTSRQKVLDEWMS